MFDVGFQELTLIGVIALIVVGPERLPKMARTLGLWMGKVRYYVGQVKSDIEREVRAQELKEMLDKPARELDDLKSVAEETKGTLDQAKGVLGEAKSAFDGAAGAMGADGEPGDPGHEHEACIEDEHRPPVAAGDWHKDAVGERERAHSTERWTGTEDAHGKAALLALKLKADQFGTADRDEGAA